MRKVGFHSEAFDEFTGWAKEDSQVFERLTRLIKETLRDPFGGIGKPEPLKHNLKGIGRAGSQTSIGLFIK